MSDRTLESIRVNYPAPTHVPKDRLIDLTFARGLMPNDLVDPYEACGWPVARTFRGCYSIHLLRATHQAVPFPAVAEVRMVSLVGRH